MDDELALFLPEVQTSVYIHYITPKYLVFSLQCVIV